jgi:hypothetical protein
MLRRRQNAAWVALFAGFVTAFGALVWLASSQPHHYRYRQNAERPRPSGSYAAPAETVASQEHTTNRSKHEEECSYGGPPWFADFYCFFALHEKFWVSFGTIILAAVTLILGAATVFLYLATRALVRSAEHTAERQLRAYVGLEATKLIELNGPKGPRVRLRVKNFGLTPAYDVVVISGLAFDSFPRDRLPPIPPTDLIQPKYPLSPTNRITQFNFLNRQLAQTEVDAFTSGAAALYLLGRIEYRDAFKKPHWYCFKMFLGGRATISDSPAFSWWHEGNDTDET